MTYTIKYKEVGRKWSKTTYTSPKPVTEEYLIEFFGLKGEDVEEFLIETETNNNNIYGE